MYKFLLFFLVLVFSPIGAVFASETQEIFVENDATVYLYDEDGIRDWDAARNFNGVLFRDPLEQGFGNNINKVSIRSDNGVGTYRIYRHSQLFDLSQIPQDAVIESVSLQLFGTPQNTNNSTAIVVTSHTRADEQMLQKIDWDITNFGTQEFSRGDIVIDQYTAYDFNSTGIQYVQDNVGGGLLLGLLTEFDFDDIVPGSLAQSAGFFSSENDGTNADPKIVVTYSIEDTNDRPNLYTQIPSPYPSEAETASWADDKFARAAGEVAIDGCETIRKCGCTITSLVMLGRGFGITNGVDGSDVNPGNLNKWLIDNNGYDKSGILQWTEAVKYFGANGLSKLKLGYEHLTESQTRSRASAGTPVITEMVAQNNSGGRVFTHFILTDSVVNGDYLVRDPLWYNTVDLLDGRSGVSFVQNYNDSIVSGRDITFEPAGVTVSGSIELYLASPAELLLTDAAGDRLGEDPRVGQTYKELEGSYWEQTRLKASLDRTGDEPVHYIQGLLVGMDDTGPYTLEVIGTDSGLYSLSGVIHGQSGESVQVDIVASTTPGQVDTFTIDAVTGEVEEVEDPVEPEDIDRDTFVGIVEAAYVDERPRTQRFFVKAANRIFDRYEAGKLRQALVKLRVFKKFVRWSQVNDADLEQAIDQLKQQIKEEQNN